MEFAFMHLIDKNIVDQWTDICLYDDLGNWRVSEKYVSTCICENHAVWRQDLHADDFMAWTRFPHYWPVFANALGPLLLTWFNFNPSMDK